MFEHALRKKEKQGFRTILARLSGRAPASRPRIAAELSDGALRIIGFRGHAPLLINAVETIPLPREFYKGGAVKDEATFSILLRHGLKRFGAHTVYAVGVLPEEKVFSRIIQKTVGEVATLDQLIDKALPIPRADLIVAAKEVVPLSRQITHQDFNVWAVEKNFFESYRATLATANVAATDFVPESVAIVAALFPQLESYDATLVIVPRETKTTMLIFAGRAVHISTALFSVAHIASAPGLVKDFVDAVGRAIAFYRDRVLHEHGASREVNRLIVAGKLGEEIETRLSFNTQLKIEYPDTLSSVHFASEALRKEMEEHTGDFLPLLGAAFLGK